MYLQIQKKVREKFALLVRELFGVETGEPSLDVPPRPEMGDLSIAACFELAKKLRQPPRKVAEQIAQHLPPLEGIERASVAGPGYLNLYLDRARVAFALLQPGVSTSAAESAVEAGRRDAEQSKIVVEHTSINPNKAAHIGHLRNAVLGDTFARLLRFRGRRVEIQNYIDNTGVQVADVVVGFAHLEKKTLEDVRRLVGTPAKDSRRPRFDYYCWDLYARVFQHYEANPDALALRAEALKAIEEGQGELAGMAELISTAIVRLHLDTMLRVNVRYDLLVQESEILRLDFWKSAFALMKAKGAIRLEESGKNRGCWVMSMGEAAPTPAEPGAEAPGEAVPDDAEDVKIIVRSNGTVTYVGKDIAYHLWKFGLLGKDFAYQPFHRYQDGATVWRTSLTPAGAASQPAAPPFGQAAVAYAVIDSRQSYVQRVVGAAFRSLGFEEQSLNLHHFAYEVVGLTPRCAEEMGIDLAEGDSSRSYVEVSGRKGLGIKADDLIDRLVNKALDEVRARNLTADPSEQADGARRIAVGALRYFLIKFSRRVIIAFDFKEALAFEGETGPYLQYSVVRARNIFRKFQESEAPSGPGNAAGARLTIEQLRTFLEGVDGMSFWELIVLAAQLEMVADQAILASEPAAIAKYAFRLAQAFNNFYHRYHILSETETARQRFLLALVALAEKTLSRTLDVLGIEVPERM